MLASSKENPYIVGMIMGRITAKSQTTIPRAVRTALGIKPGDDVAYEIRGHEVVMKRAIKPAKDMFLANFSTFTEWESEADRIGYSNL
jgi:antitoxin PrlF